MPRAPKSPQSSDEDVKPYARSSTASSTPSPKKSPSASWSGEEKLLLLQFAVKHGAPGSNKGWEGVVPGKSGSKCRDQWR